MLQREEKTWCAGLGLGSDPDPEIQSNIVVGLFDSFRVQNLDICRIKLMIFRYKLGFNRRRVSVEFCEAF